MPSFSVMSYDLVSLHRRYCE